LGSVLGALISSSSSLPHDDDEEEDDEDNALFCFRSLVFNARL
jgi:hypothetical protein